MHDHCGNICPYSIRSFVFKTKWLQIKLWKCSFDLETLASLLLHLQSFVEQRSVLKQTQKAKSSISFAKTLVLFVFRFWINTTLLTTFCRSPTRVSSYSSCPGTHANRCWRRNSNMPFTSASPSTRMTTPASPSPGSPRQTTAARTPTTRTPTPLPPTPHRTTWRDTEFSTDG